MKIILSILISFFVIFAVMGQSKKSQIEFLSNQVDSLNSLLTTERIDNLKEVKDLESNNLFLKSKLKTEEENLIKVIENLKIISKELSDQKDTALGQRKELDQVKKELEKSQTKINRMQNEYNNIESLFRDLLLSKEREKIEKTYEERMINVEQVYFGDLSGDYIDEIIYYYVLVNKDGGNSSAGTGMMIYQIENNEIKFFGKYFSLKNFEFDKIENGGIYIDFLEYAEGDGNCCPSVVINKRLELGIDVL